MGVKLMEINVTTCFPGRNNYVIFGRVLRDEKNITQENMDFQVVISNMFNFHPYLGKIPILDSYFSNGLKPPIGFLFPRGPRTKKSQGFQKSPGGLDPAPSEPKKRWSYPWKTNHHSL